MFINKSEAHARVLEAIDDVKVCCEVEDDYTEWDDIAASSITAFLEDLTAEQLDDTCGAFKEYITDRDTPYNLAMGIRSALVICFSEMFDYIGDIPESTEDDRNTDDGDIELFNKSQEETRQFISVLKTAHSDIESLNI